MPSAELITRQILFNVPQWLAVLFYVAALAACLLAAVLIVRRLAKHRRGRVGGPVERPPLASRLAEMVGYLAFHRQLLRDPYAGVAHLLVFYGFFILFVGTCLVFLEHDTPLHFFYGSFYLIASLIVDLGGVAFLVGLLMFLWRRFVGQTSHALRAWWVTSLGVLLLAIGVTGFLLEGARIAIDMPAFESWSCVGYMIALVLRTVGIHADAAATLHRVLWIGHAALCVLLFALVPWRFFGHMVYAPLSWTTRTGRPAAQLRMSDLTQHGAGSTTWTDLLRRDLLQVDACTTCGRCNAACPATASGKPLQPRDVVLAIRQSMDQSHTIVAENGTSPSALSDLIPDDTLWSCTTCGACNETCPVGIEVYDKIVELRRGRIEAGEIPHAAEQVIESCATDFNPFERPAEERFDWSRGLEVSVANADEPIELLYWVGCAGSFDPDGQAVSRAMITILNQLGIDYRVLGPRERCNGDPARRMGEEGLFRQLARENLALLGRHSVRHVLTHCPHCFNMFRNEYPQLGARFEVEHHSQFLARMIGEGRLQMLSKGAKTVTFHDPCYLSRGNGETQAPRDVLSAVCSDRPREMPRHGRKTFCCGAGGGSMWLDVRGETRVENLRAAEAAATGASIVATGCPFCKSMLIAGSAALGGTGPPLRVRDLAELIVEEQGW